MKAYDIRLATLADCVELEILVNSAYRGEISRRGWTTEADYLDGQRSNAENLAADLRRPGCSIFCLREARAGAILGCVFIEDQKGGERYFGMLAVQPDLQAGGIGRALLGHIEDDARRKGFKRMTMRVLQNRAALIAWYERRGYRRTGETAPFPYGDENFGIPKRDDLQFLVFTKEL
jgi:ribosomal protein S18 acetylase RimI-like enzyme